jgi:hypothetical protein
MAAAATIKKDDVMQMSFSNVRELWGRLTRVKGAQPSPDEQVVIDAACEMIVLPQHNSRSNRGKLEEIRGMIPVGAADSQITIALGMAESKK